MRLAFATVLALLMFATPAVAQVSSVTVDNTAPTSAVSARTLYAVEFTATSGLASTDRINVTVPVGTTFTGGVTSDVRVGTTDVGSCFGPSGLTIQCFLSASVASGARVRMTFAGVTNAGTVGQKTLTVGIQGTAQSGTGTFDVVAGGDVSDVTFTHTGPSPAAGARTAYDVEFTTSATGALANAANSHITLTMPEGTSFPGGVTSNVLVGVTDVGFCFSPSGLTIDCALNTNATVAAGARVRITLAGVTNPTTTGAKRVAVSTTSDLDTVDSSPVNVVAAHIVSDVTLANTGPSAAAGARTIYAVEFTTSATGALASAANSHITLTMPQGTTFPGGVTSNVLVGATDVGFCFSPSGLTIDCALNTNATIAAGARVRITLAGVTNPADGQHRVTVSTTSDPDTVDSSPVNIVPDGDVSAVTLTHTGPSPAAGARTAYAVEFTTSSTGGLANAANSHITLTMPEGTSFPGGVTSNVLVGATDVGFCFSPSGLTIDCALNTNATIVPGARVRITLAGVTNPPDGQYRVTVSTTSDLGNVDSSAVNVVPDGDVSAVTLTHTGPSLAAGARTIYAVEFTTSATGALANAANSHITLTMPEGTSFPGGVTSNVLVGATDVGFCFSPSGLTIDCALNTNATIAAGARVRITLAGVTNPPDGQYRVTVTTTSDPDTVDSSAVNVVTAGTLGAVTAAVTNPAPSATTQYTVDFTTSATGALSNAANSRITVVFAAGTTFPAGVSSDVQVGTADVGGCFSPNGLVIDCFLNVNAAVAAGARVRLTFGGVQNPSTAGSYSVLAATTSDPAQVAASFDVGNDTVAPETTITSGPTGSVSSTSASFTFSSTETGSTFQCALDSAAFGACPLGYTGLSQGSHTFQVRATDSAGNIDASPASRTWTVDTIAPDTSILTGPSGTVNSTSATFTFNSTEGGSTFQCSFDGAAFGACPAGYTGLSQGSHTFQVRATDSAGNIDASPASRTWTVDTVAPDTSITAGPTGSVSSTSATFTFGSTDAGSTFQCSFDGAAFGACPTGYTGLSQGSHTFQVRATDAAGNFDASPASRTWTVDTAAPDTSITAGPTGTVSSTSATFTFTATEAGSTFQCALDGAPFGACPAGYTGLSQGSHTFQVRATDAAGNTDGSPASRTWTVDTVPDTTITAGPTGTVSSTSATFTFTSTEAGSTFQCSFDGAAFGACPAGYTGLSQGPHTFQVRAIDAAGNTDASPASRTWTVDTVQPNSTITAGANTPGSDPTPTFSFTSTESGATFQCRVDAAAFATCTSPHTTAALAPGSHTFEVRAVDAAGNVGTPATRAFMIVTPTPTATPIPIPTPMPVPPPQFNQSVVVKPVSGTVLVCLRGEPCRPLQTGERIPIGSTVDARKGVVELASVSAPGAPPQSARFSGGIFRVSQRGGVTVLTLTEPLAPCGKNGRAAAKKPKSRRLWGHGSGKFRTAGQYSSATVRGTRWLVQDSCTGTLTRVTEGVVSVRDDVRRKTVTVRKGASYLAKPRR